MKNYVESHSQIDLIKIYIYQNGDDLVKQSCFLTFPLTYIWKWVYRFTKGHWVFSESVISELAKWRQEYSELKANLGYIALLCLKKKMIKKGEDKKIFKVFKIIPLYPILRKVRWYWNFIPQESRQYIFRIPHT